MRLRFRKKVDGIENEFSGKKNLVLIVVMNYY